MLQRIDHGPILEIRLARPPVNALNPELVSRLSTSLTGAGENADAVVLSGLPGIFSAGLDVVELLPLDRRGMQDFWSAFVGLLETIACSKVPVATAITGHCPAGGALISMMTDYRVMSRGDYRIGLNETRVGLVLPALLQGAMARLAGPRLAEQLIVTGALLDPEQARETGLVDALEADYNASIDHAVQWCEDLLALPRQAMLGNRAIARAQYQEAFGRYRQQGVKQLTDVWFSTETQAELHALVARLKRKR